MKKYLPGLFFLCLAGQGAAFEAPAAQRYVAEAPIGAVRILFTPEEDVTTPIVQAIYEARRQVLVQAYSFTSKPIARALVDARRRGVDVQVIADAEQAGKTTHGRVSELAAKGVPVFLDDRHAAAHNKVMVIDAGTGKPVVVTGSFNFTYAGQHKNAENVVLFLNNQELAAAYLRNWRRHREHARPLPQ